MSDLLMVRCIGERHGCRGLLAQAFRQQQPAIVIHHHSPTVVSVQLHLIPSRRQLSPVGKLQVATLMVDWHSRGWYDMDTVPKAFIDPVKCRWIGLQYKRLVYVLEDLKDFLAERSNTMPIIPPNGDVA